MLVSAVTPAVGEHVDEVQAVRDAAAGFRARVRKREEALAGIRDLDVDTVVLALGEQRDIVVSSQAGVTDRVGDKFGGEQCGHELEVGVRAELRERLDLLACGTCRLERRRQANRNHPTPSVRVSPSHGLER